MVSNARAIQDATAILIRPVSAMVISARILVAASTRPVESTKTNRNVIVHRIIHPAIRCTHVRIHLSYISNGLDEVMIDRD